MQYVHFLGNVKRNYEQLVNAMREKMDCGGDDANMIHIISQNDNCFVQCAISEFFNVYRLIKMLYVYVCMCEFVAKYNWILFKYIYLLYMCACVCVCHI